MEKLGFVYMMTNKSNSVIYTGVTSNLKKRVYEHKNKMVPGFTQRYNAAKLVYYEMFPRIEDAIEREKQIKAGSRKRKEHLISKLNPEYRDLYESIL